MVHGVHPMEEFAIWAARSTRRFKKRCCWAFERVVHFHHLLFVDPMLADARVDADSLDTNDTVDFEDGALPACKSVTDGPTWRIGLNMANHDFSDFGPAHGRKRSGFLKGHSNTQGNFLFADGHVSVFTDVNGDKTFNYDQQAQARSRGRRFIQTLG